jgi:hypothetical protein
VEFDASNYSVGEEAGSVTITVKLSQAVSDSVTVDYQSSDGTGSISNANATAGSDYDSVSGILTFPPSQTTETFTVPILDDGADDEYDGNESFGLTLSNPTHAGLGPTSDATVTIDEDIPTVQFAAANYGVSETAGSVEVTVDLSEAVSASVSVRYQTSDGTATAGTDYGSTSGLLTFAPGQTSQVITVPILDDGDGDDNIASETFGLTLSDPTSATLGTIPDTSVTIDEDIPKVEFAAPAYNVTESTGSLSVTVELSQPLPIR